MVFVGRVRQKLSLSFVIVTDTAHDGCRIARRRQPRRSRHAPRRRVASRRARLLPRAPRRALPFARPAKGTTRLRKDQVLTTTATRHRFRSGSRVVTSSTPRSSPSPSRCGGTSRTTSATSRDPRTHPRTYRHRPRDPGTGPRRSPEDVSGAWSVRSTSSTASSPRRPATPAGSRTSRRTTKSAEGPRATGRAYRSSTTHPK